MPCSVSHSLEVAEARGMVFPAQCSGPALSGLEKCSLGAEELLLQQSTSCEGMCW